MTTIVNPVLSAEEAGGALMEATNRLKTMLKEGYQDSKLNAQVALVSSYAAQVQVATMNDLRYTIDSALYQWKIGK